MWDYAPPMDVYETEGELVIELELPEVERDNVKITVKGQTLTVEGIKSYKVGEEKVKFLRLERYSGYFKRVVQLPFAPKEEGIKATMKKGVLKITISKDRSRRIEVEE